MLLHFFFLRSSQVELRWATEWCSETAELQGEHFSAYRSALLPGTMASTSEQITSSVRLNPLITIVARHWTVQIAVVGSRKQISS